MSSADTTNAQDCERGLTKRGLRGIGYVWAGAVGVTFVTGLFAGVAAIFVGMMAVVCACMVTESIASKSSD